jgi:hypothetical protein
LDHFKFPVIHHPWPPTQLPSGAGRSQTSLGSLPDNFSFKLGKCPKHMKYQFPSTIRGIHVFLKTVEAYALFMKIIHRFD